MTWSGLTRSGYWYAHVDCTYIIVRSYVACVSVVRTVTKYAADTYLRMDLRMDGRHDLRYAFRTDFPIMERRTYEYETLTFCSLPYVVII